MKNSKLITYLKTLSNSEIRDLGQFIVYKTAKGTNDLNTLFNYLKKLHPIFPEKKTEKKYVLRKVFKKEPKSVKRLINTVYKLGLILDEYLILDVLNEQENEKDFLLLIALQKRKLNKSFFKKSEQIQEGWQKVPRAGISQLYDEFKLKEMCLSHPHYSLAKEMPITHDAVINLMDKYYFALKLYWNVSYSNNSNYIVNSKSENIISELFIDEIINVTYEYSEYRTIQGKLFADLIIDFRDKNYSNYYKYKNDFFKYFYLFSQKEKSDILTLLYHACYENYKKNVPNAQDELFELSCFIVDNDLLLVDGYISTTIFWTIIHIGLALGELDWTNNVIEKYSKYLNEDMITICRALVDFNKSNYLGALQLLSTVKFPDPTYGLYTKSAQLQCYFELGENYRNPFHSLSKSFYLYITRKHKFSKLMKDGFCNFISIATQLQNAKDDPNKNVKDVLHKINLTENIAYKSWLLKKVKDVSDL